MSVGQIVPNPVAQVFPDSQSGEDGISSVSAAFGDDGFTFGDLIDIINPLQHIPIISTIYRKITGDEIAAAPRVIGDGLFGGALGLVSGLVNVAVEQETGKDLGEHVVAMFENETTAPSTSFASLQPKAGTASGGDLPAPAPAAHITEAARQYQMAGTPSPIYGRTLDIGP